MKKILTSLLCMALIMSMSVPFVFAEEEQPQLVLSKRAVPLDNGNYSVLLEGYATGEITVTQVEKSKPCDIVLVVDTSGSMGDNSNYKMLALKEACNNFIENVAADATNNSVDHKIGIVSFASVATNLTGGLLDASSEKESIKSLVNQLEARGATAADYGLEMANSIIPPEDSGRNRVVVFFTDGEPNHYNGFDNNVANFAIQQARLIKNKNTKVFSVAINKKASPDFDINKDYLWPPNIIKKKFNKFLHYVSSNYPYANSLEDGGVGSNQGYYITADDVSSLNNVFEKISEAIESGSTSTELDEKAVIKDIISPYFSLKDGTTAGNVNVYTKSYMGKDGSGQMLWGDKERFDEGVVSLDGKTVSVSGFDFCENFVGNKNGESHGKKILVEIEISRKPGFIGGNQVPSNGGLSGVYLDDKAFSPIQNFAVPTVDVPIDFDYMVKDKTIYLSNTVNQDDFIATPGQFIQNGLVYDFDGINDAFVNVEYGAYREDEQVHDFAPVDCTQLKMKCSVTPNLSGSVEKYDVSSKDVNLHVLRPTVDTMDRTIYLGQIIDLSTTAMGDINWNDSDGHTDIPEVDANNKPDIEMEFWDKNDGSLIENTVEFLPEEETLISIRTKIGDRDITDLTGFRHDLCEYVFGAGKNKKECKWDVDENYNDVFIHLKTCTLIIEKQGSKSIDENQSHIFRVTGPGYQDYKVAVKGNDKVKISGLRVGKYIVSEDTNWSWRYLPVNLNDEIHYFNPEVNGDTKTVVVTNRRVNTKWLDGHDFAKNIFESLSGPATREVHHEH